MIQPNLVEKVLDSRTLGIAAARRNLPVTMRMGPYVTHRNLAKCPTPCVQCAASRADKPVYN